MSFNPNEHPHAMSNLLARSPLFGVLKKGTRKSINGLIKNVDGIFIIFEGIELEQADLNVWLEILSQSFSKSDDGYCFTGAVITLRSVLREIGRSGGGNNEKWLLESIERLKQAHVSAIDDQYVFRGNLLQYVDKTNKSGHYTVLIDSSLTHLYGKNGWSEINLNQKNRLKKNQLAQWLFCFYSTYLNADQIPAFEVEFLHRLSGSHAASLSGFRRSLNNALSLIQREIFWVCNIDQKDYVQIRIQ